MEFFVNGEKIDITLQDEKTINDVLKAFEVEAEKHDATTIAIKINGNKIDAKNFDEAVSCSLEENTKIELEVLSKAELITIFKTSKVEFQKLSETLPEIPVMLQSGKDADANKIITELTNAVDSFCHTITLSALFCDLYEKIQIDKKDLGTFFEEFVPIFSDFEKSLQTKDTVTSGDLCEYEIAPRLKKIADAIETSLN